MELYGGEEWGMAGMREYLKELLFVNIYAKSTSMLVYEQVSQPSSGQAVELAVRSKRCTPTLGTAWRYDPRAPSLAAPPFASLLNHGVVVVRTKLRRSKSDPALLQVEKTTLTAFIGNLGGVLGLWLGASVVTVIQVLYFCCRIAARKRSATRSPPSPPDHHPQLPTSSKPSSNRPAAARRQRVSVSPHTPPHIQNNAVF